MRTWLPVAAVLLSGVMAPKADVEAQRTRQVDRRCRLELVRVERRGVRVQTAPGVVNMFLGGNVHVRCVGQNVNMFADSVAIFGDNVAQFIGNVRYRDSVTAMDALFGQYNKVTNDEYFDAQGNVKHRDLKTGSTIEGPRVIYYRAIEGLRPDGEVLADDRPTVRYVIEDSLGQATEPYVIVGNRVKLTGSEAIYAYGRATVRRSDLDARADTVWIDSGKRSAGQLQGAARLRGIGKDSFEVRGRSIDLGLHQKEIQRLLARDCAQLDHRDVKLEADSLQIELAGRAVERTTAWGKMVRPRAVSADYEVRGDSLIIESPGQRLQTLRSYGDGWVGLRPDSATAGRDWIAGNRVVVSFAERDSAGTRGSAVREVQAEQQARCYYRMAPERPGQRASVNYTRADRIVVMMRVTADSNTVERVVADGNVDGVHLQPSVARPDSTRDTTATRRVVPGGRP